MKKYFFIRKLHFIFTPSIHLNTKNKVMKNQEQMLREYGSSLIGKYAQSRLLMEIVSDGKQKLAAPEKITGYEIVYNFGEPQLMCFIDGTSIYEDLLINIH